MRQVLTILMVIGLLWAGVKVRDYFQSAMQRAQAEVDGPSGTAPGKLPGMPSSMETSLDEAKRGGASGLRDWLRQHQDEVQDPRLAEIQLDYVVLVGLSNRAEAKRVLGLVGQRMTPTSPLYKRFQQLQQSYQ